MVNCAVMECYIILISAFYNSSYSKSYFIFSTPCSEYTRFEKLSPSATSI